MREIVFKLIALQPRGIVVDAHFDLSRSDHKELLLDLTKSQRGEKPGWPLIFVPIDIRPDNSASASDLSQSPNWAFQTTHPGWFDPQFLQAVAHSPVRLVPSLIYSDAKAGDGIARNAPAKVAVGDGERFLQMPNLPFALSRLSSARNIVDFDCATYNCGLGTSLPRFTNRTTAIPHEQPRHIQYTIPALSAEDDGRCEDQTIDPDEKAFCAVRQSRWRAFAPLYVHERLSSLLVDGFDYDKTAAHDAIFIIGSSLPSAEDLHPTPLGTMSGPEVLVNAAHTFATAADPTESESQQGKRAFDTWTKKIAGSLLAVVIVTFFYFISAFINAIMDRKSSEWRHHRRYTFLTTTAFTFLALTVCIILEMHELDDQLYDTANHGVVVDSLTPIVALLFERYAEIAKTLTHFFERLGRGLVERGENSIRRLYDLVAARG